MSIVARRAHREAGAQRCRAGFSLVEVIVAMMLIIGVVLALGGFTAKFAQANSQAHLVIAANEITAQRLDEVRQQPTYSSIDLIKDSVNVTYDFQTFSRQTVVKRIGGAATDSVDYRLVTVTVRHPSMKKTVSKTTAVAAF
jgi:Tfp pilus assembly protein PilV